jgi:CMP-N-acetylneuraminic acid synthetase
VSVYIIIPARLNSKRLKKKNLLKLNNQTLVERTISFSNKINFAKKIIISSDIDFKNRFSGKKIITIKRPKKLARDNTSIIQVIFHIIKILKKKEDFKNSSFLLLQPTSPFRSLANIINGYKKFLKNKKKYSIISVSKTPKDTNNIKNRRIFYIKRSKLYLKNNSSENHYKDSYICNGNFYFASLSFLYKYKSFNLEGKSESYIINNKKLAVDIDAKKDYLLAKKYLK